MEIRYCRNYLHLWFYFYDCWRWTYPTFPFGSSCEHGHYLLDY